MSEQLESIYPQLSDCCPKQETVHSNSTGGGKFAYFILWWVILVVIIWFIIYSLQPSWIMKGPDSDCEGGSCKKKCEVDQGKAVLVAVIIALIIMLLFYFVSSRYGW
jgi:di/tricarboxylate transporter